MIFKVNNYVYQIEKDEGETIEHHNTKGWFAAYLKPLDEEEMNYALKLGNIYANIIHLDCKYNKNIIAQLNEHGVNIPFYTPL